MGRGQQRVVSVLWMSAEGWIRDHMLGDMRRLHCCGSGKISSVFAA